MLGGLEYTAVMGRLRTLAGEAGASLIGCIQTGTGAVHRFVQDKLRDEVSVFDFMTAAQIADVRGYTYLLDVTASIQAAIDTGRSFRMPYGGYKTTASLNQITAANHGQIVRGVGPVSKNGGAGTKKTIIKPSAAVTKAFVIDGTGFGNYVQYFGFEDLTVDMTNMADVSTTAAFDQKHAWGGTYRNCTTINQGSNKRGLLFEAGAYTTLVEGGAYNIIEATGASGADQATTLTFLNVDAVSYIFKFASAINITGGALQGAGGNRISLDSVTGLMVNGVDVEGSGVYLHFVAPASNSNSIFATGNQLTGFSGTISDGTPTRPYIITDQAAVGAFHMTSGEFQFSNGGANTTSRLLSGANGFWYSLALGRTGSDFSLSVAANANDFVTGTAAGEGVVGGTAWWLQGGSAGIAKVSATLLAMKAAAFAEQSVTATYGVNVAITASAGNEFVISPNNGVAFQINNPTAGTTGQRITIRIRNSSGGALGAITWDTAYKLAAWTSPANGFARAIDFRYDGSSWVEMSRTTADVPL